jgi:hypothetical protein
MSSQETRKIFLPTINLSCFTCSVCSWSIKSKLGNPRQHFNRFSPVIHIDSASLSVRCNSLGLANRQRVILTVHFCLNMLSLTNTPSHLGGVIDMHTDLITVVQFDEIGTWFNAPHFGIQGQTKA